MKDLKLKAADGVDLGGYLWHIEKPKATVAIIHGMAEHSARYDGFAKHLNDKGYAVLSIDLRGHGKSVQDGKKGYFAPKGGMEKVVGDIKLLVETAKNTYKDVPVVMFGHSMGSIFARVFISEHPGCVKSCILSGVTINKKGLRDIAPFMTSVFSLFGADKPSKTLDSLSFGAFNKPFEPAKTDFDWLSRDEAEVKKYVDDELCGFVCTPSLFYDVSKAILYTLKKENIHKIDKDTDIFIVSGAKDPVGSDGFDAKYLHEAYTNAGLKAKFKVYEDARHELLNEINKHEVISDISQYLEAVFA